jgi:Secretory lipase
MRTLAATFCVLLPVAAGCSDGSRLVEGVVGEQHEAPFYAVPDPLPPGAPGTIVRSEPLPQGAPGANAWRVLYHSRDLNGADTLVSGLVVAPATPAPSGGRTIVSWAHPTTGAAQRCAQSLGVDPFDLIEGLQDLLKAGYVVAASDYPGMGGAGPDSYLIGASDGHSVLDAARGARSLPTGANARLLLWGHSQGGQAPLQGRPGLGGMSYGEARPTRPGGALVRTGPAPCGLSSTRRNQSRVTASRSDPYPHPQASRSDGETILDAVGATSSMTGRGFIPSCPARSPPGWRSSRAAKR